MCTLGRENLESWGRRRRSIGGPRKTSEEMTLSQEILVLDIGDEPAARSMTEKPPAVNGKAPPLSGDTKESVKALSHSGNSWTLCPGTRRKRVSGVLRHDGEGRCRTTCSCSVTRFRAHVFLVLPVQAAQVSPQCDSTLTKPTSQFFANLAQVTSRHIMHVMSETKSRHATSPSTPKHSPCDCFRLPGGCERTRAGAVPEDDGESSLLQNEETNHQSN